jgi:hypothetical protein
MAAKTAAAASAMARIRRVTGAGRLPAGSRE